MKVMTKTNRFTFHMHAMKYITFVLFLAMTNSCFGSSLDNEPGNDALDNNYQTVDTSSLKKLIANKDISAPMLLDGDHIFYDYDVDSSDITYNLININ